MSDGDYERRELKEAELKKFSRLIAEAHVKKPRENNDKSLDENKVLHQ